MNFRIGKSRIGVRFPPRPIFTFFFLAVFVAALLIGWEWPYIAKLMPVYVAAIPGLLLAVVQFYRDLTGWEEKKEGGVQGIEMDEVFTQVLDRWTEISRTLTFFGWFAGGAMAIWLLGIVMALPLLVFLYALVEGRERWSVSLLTSAGVFLLIWGLFEYALEIRWPSGVLFG